MLRERDIQLVNLGYRDGDTIQLNLLGEQVEAPSLLKGFLQQDGKVPNLERQPGALFIAVPVFSDITKDRNGNEQSTRLALEVGDLSVLLKKALKQRWRFNLLTKKIELDGVTVPVAEIDQLYVALSEHGYKIEQRRPRTLPKQRRWPTRSIRSQII